MKNDATSEPLSSLQHERQEPSQEKARIAQILRGQHIPEKIKMKARQEDQTGNKIESRFQKKKNIESGFTQTEVYCE